MEMEDEVLLGKLNDFTRRELTKDEVYIFDVVLCDNDVDRQNEAFSDKALDTLQKLFIGKTGIFDHNPKGANQNSRIFDTEVVLDDNKTTKVNTPYKCLKAHAYMVRTNTNEDLIKEIDGGIKKEVSISCTAKTHKCSICGKDKYDKGCNHINGKYYGGKLCYTILDDITDAYEWSFVAVPAQVNAGVVKHFGELNTQSVTTLENPTINALAEDLKKDIIRLGFLKNDTSNVLQKHMDMLSLEDLITLKRDLLSKPNPNEKVVSQLRFEKSNNGDNLNEFKLR
jgi:hypothetical protein